MTKVTLLLVLPVLVFGFATATAEDFDDIPIQWAEKPITVDGKTDDWSGLSTRFLYEPAAVVGLASDSTNLYLMVRFQDNRWAMMIKRAGLKLWIDPEGKKKEIFMLKYRGGPSQEQMQLLGGESGGDRPGFPTDRMRPPDREGRGDNRPLTCFIKDRIEEKEIPVDGSEGPRAAFGLDQGFFVYEFAVPLDAGGVRYYGLGDNGGDAISVGFFWGDLSEMRREGGRPGGGMRGGGPPGGMGGMGGGGREGMGGDRPGGMRGQRPEMPDPVEFWIKTKLAEPGSK